MQLRMSKFFRVNVKSTKPDIRNYNYNIISWKYPILIFNQFYICELTKHPPDFNSAPNTCTIYHELH